MLPIGSVGMFAMGQNLPAVSAFRSIIFYRAQPIKSFTGSPIKINCLPAESFPIPPACRVRAHGAI